MLSGLRGACVVMFVALLVACGGSKYGAVGTARAPGADAVTQVEEIEGGQLLLTVHVTNLPAPERIAAEMKVFVVWLEPEKGGAPKVAGVLDYDEDNREGTLAATTKDKNFALRITAEPTTKVAAPGDIVIIQQRISES